MKIVPILGGLPLPYAPPPLQNRFLFQELAGMRISKPVSFHKPLDSKTVDEITQGMCSESLKQKIMLSKNSEQCSLSLHERFKKSATIPWLGQHSSNLLDKPVPSVEPGTPQGLCWSTLGGHAAIALIALLGAENRNARTLCEDWEDWSHTNFSDESARALGLIPHMVQAKGIIESRVELHAFEGSLVARLVEDALLRRDWVPSWTSWMRQHARGAWLLVSSGARDVAWPEVAPSRACMREEKREGKPLVGWPLCR